MALLSHSAQPKALVCRARARCNCLPTFGLMRCWFCFPPLFQGKRCVLVCRLARTRPAHSTFAQVAQLVYVAVGCVVLYMVKVLLTVRARPCAITCASELRLVMRRLSSWWQVPRLASCACPDGSFTTAQSAPALSMTGARCRGPGCFVLPFLGADDGRSRDAAQRDRWPPEGNERPRHGAGCFL
jgi:hypothetical protein